MTNGIILGYVTALNNSIAHRHIAFLVTGSCEGFVDVRWGIPDTGVPELEITETVEPRKTLRSGTVILQSSPTLSHTLTADAIQIEQNIPAFQQFRSSWATEFLVRESFCSKKAHPNSYRNRRRTRILQQRQRDLQADDDNNDDSMDVDSADANNSDGDRDGNEDDNDGTGPAEGDDSASENADDDGMLED